MPVRYVLDESSRQEFDAPPKLAYQERKVFFALPVWAEDQLRDIHLPVNKLGFILQLGYFRAAGRFFKTKTFKLPDREYIARIHGYDLTHIQFALYDPATSNRHRTLILENLGVAAFDHEKRTIVLAEAVVFAGRQLKPYLVFKTLADFIRSHRIEVPSYHILAGIVLSAFKELDEKLALLITEHMSEELRKQLDALLTESDLGDTDSVKKPFLLTVLKRSKEVMKPMIIKATIAEYVLLKQLYLACTPVVKALSPTKEMIEYYAGFVLRAQVFQIYRQEKRKYLMLICFIVHQYYYLGDMLVETLLRSAQQFENTSQQEVKEAIYRRHAEMEEKLHHFFDMTATMISSLQAMEQVILGFGQTNDEKVKTMIAWVNTPLYQEFIASLALVSKFKKGGYIKKNDAYYQVLEEKSRSLQSKVSDILRHVELEASSPQLQHALADFKKRDGKLSDSMVTGFLSKRERQALEHSSSKTSLYKVLLTQHVTENIKGGSVNLPSSFRYKAFDTYLLNGALWQSEKQALLEKANLTEFSQWKSVENQISLELIQLFHNTFSRLDDGSNAYVKKRKDGKPGFTEPKEEEKEGGNFDLFPKQRLISIFEVLTTVNRCCSFTDALQHWNTTPGKARPAEKTFFAGILAYGCNIGTTKMAFTSKDISVNTLENTINWYFTPQQLSKANDAIVNFMGKLNIGKLFRKEPDVLHTSSDGQKFYIQVDSIHANYSYKYFGNEKGIVLYTFIDEMHRLFDSTAFSSSEREAPHIIDGLLHNETVQSDIHSSDSHGFTDVIFAITYFIRIRFAPRIADFQSLIFYPLPGMTIPLLNEYDLKIGKPVDTALIEENWDMILRMMASIKLKHVSASALLRRLNSYSKIHPLYLALKEFGKLIRTRFLLGYMNDENLRKRISNQLEKVESAHKFARAVFYDNNGEIRYSSKEQHLMTDACKRLIQNSIICWNYLYLTKLVTGIDSKEKKSLLERLARMSPVSWAHINLHGEFDFSDEALIGALEFNIEELLNLDLEI